MYEWALAKVVELQNRVYIYKDELKPLSHNRKIVWKHTAHTSRSSTSSSKTHCAVQYICKKKRSSERKRERHRYTNTFSHKMQPIKLRVFVWCMVHEPEYMQKRTLRRPFSIQSAYTPHTIKCMYSELK